MTSFPEPSLQVLHFNEPPLEFAHRQLTAHPKDGLFLYGPHLRAKKSREVRLGVIGTPKGIEYFREWLKKIKVRIEVPPPGKTEKRTSQISPAWKKASALRWTRISALIRWT